MSVYSPGRISPAIFMQQILFSSYYISITLMASQWVNMAGEVVPGLYNNNSTFQSDEDVVDDY